MGSCRHVQTLSEDNGCRPARRADRDRLERPRPGPLREDRTGDCAPVEPDSVQISWDAPCTNGDWLFEPDVGCRMWDWHPFPTDNVTWTGQCTKSQKVGWGVVQWFEHGRPIDRFEGTFVAGKRQGAGRYTWNDDNWYVGLYDEGLPNGLGTARIAGETFSGQWQAGCFRHGGKAVAIGVPRKSCDLLWMRTAQR